MVSEENRALLIEEGSARKPETVAFLKEMVRTPSVNPPGEYDEIHQLVVSEFERLGWDVDTIWAPDSLLNELDLPYPRPNIVSHPIRNGDPSIALSAHLDTVPADPSEWSHAPFGAEEEDGFIYGRGAKDCKSRIAAYTLAARLLTETDLLASEPTLILMFTADEETGGEAGTGHVVNGEGIHPDFAIVEGNINQIRHAASGYLRLRIAIEGKSSHVARPEQGANAVYGAGRILSALERYSAELMEERSVIEGIHGPSCTATTIDGGLEPNIVPASCSMTVDLRVPPDYDTQDLERRFHDVIENTELSDGLEAVVERTQEFDPYLFDREETQVQAVKRNAEAVRGEEIPIVGSAGSTDTRYFEPVGTRCVNFGPGDERSNSHGADENVSVDQIIEAGVIVAAAILDITDEYDG